MLSALYAAALLGVRLCVTRGRRRKGTEKEKEEGGGVRGGGGGGTGEPDLDLGREEPDIGRTVQFVACLLGTYLHVPLLLGHVALFVPSALLWTAVLALIVPPLSLSASFSSSLSSSRGLVVGWDPRFRAAAAAGGVAALGPTVVLVPGLIGSYTPYVVGVYLPLHLLLASLTVLSLSS